MIKSSLFLLVKEPEGLTAYPIILQMPMDSEGYRYVNFLPLVEMKSKPQIGLAVIHRNTLNAFEDLIIKEYELSEEDETAVTLCLNNMLCGTRYLYSPMSQAELEIEYQCFAKSVCHMMLRLLSSTTSQKGFLGSLYGIFQRYLPVLNLSSREIMDFMEVLDTIVEETVDQNGYITIESVTKALESIGTETEQEFQANESSSSFEDDEDASFFAGLFA